MSWHFQPLPVYSTSRTTGPKLSSKEKIDHGRNLFVFSVFFPDPFDRLEMGQIRRYNLK